MDICRAITFINYHIPMVIEENTEIQYTTVGFFDGMLTERLEINYGRNELKQLWKYGLKRTAKSMGQYSYQNISVLVRMNGINIQMISFGGRIRMESIR